MCLDGHRGKCAAALPSSSLSYLHVSNFVELILVCISQMPVLDGLAATRQIRLDEKEGRRQGHQRIVALTGNARNAQKEAALAAGMDLVLTKPYKCVSLFSLT